MNISNLNKCYVSLTMGPKDSPPLTLSVQGFKDIGGECQELAKRLFEEQKSPSLANSEISASVWVQFTPKQDFPAGLYVRSFQNALLTKQGNVSISDLKHFTVCLTEIKGNNQIEQVEDCRKKYLNTLEVFHKNSVESQKDS